MRKAALFTAIVAALALAGTALADQWQVHRTAAGNAAARASVIARADLGTATGWSGGFKAPDMSSTPPCHGFAPKQSDLVVVGASASVWQHSGLELQSQANILKTSAMVQLDWKRTILDTRVTPCLRETLVKQLGAGAKLVHFGVLAFPKVAPLERCYRAILTTSGVKVFVDVLALAKGRTEIELLTVAPLAADSVIRIAERRLAEKLVARAKA